MNNYVDERFIPYKRPQMTIKSADCERKGAPLTRKHSSDGIVTQVLRMIAAIFLLFLSTFGGEKVKESDINVGKVVKKCLLYAGIILALWLALVVVSNLVNAVTLLPTWSLIVIFAVTILATAGVKLN